MKRFVIFIIFLGFVLPLYSQPSQLVDKKIISVATNGFKKYNDDSGYVLTCYPGTTQIPLTSNIGIWENVDHNWTINDTVFRGLTLVYNADLIPVAEMNLPGASYQNDIAPFSNQKLVIQVPGSPPFDLPSSAHPPISNFSASAPVDVSYFTFDANNNSADGMFYYTKNEPVNMPLWPFPGYASSVYDGSTNVTYKSNAVLNDSLYISYLNLTGNQSLNNTLNFSGYGDEINLLRCEYNLLTNEITAQQIGSNVGSLATFGLKASEDGNDIYRVGMVRGNNTPVSESGAQLQMVPNDSLYHAFLTKESAQGNTEWLTELYAYNNTGKDTSDASVFAIRYHASNEPVSIVEDNGDVFLNMRTDVYAPYSDSLLYRNFLGNDDLYYDLLPNLNFDSATYQIPFSRINLFKVNDTGTIEKNLMYTPRSTSSNENQYLLYKVADKLAWVFYHNYSNASTVVFTRVNADGSTENTTIDFPAGRSVNILWLNTDLEILDKWTIPYTIPDFPESSFDTGLSINGVYPYHGDTLLIQGISITQLSHPLILLANRKKLHQVRMAFHHFLLFTALRKS